ncbi:PREDICTED: uncharacterized protein LOC101309407 [Fragaria vesca subsp. vesca]|uniref:uncharacterized protein LOC101309407 n=1 Tax=Fragaria vesca subsp. vesca TaxID=101020 RepID=UPI0002C32062|nr:PREDICTED: uncharacterized protein LOC101309407 [Fragaria vesca subsp. vesca]
MGGGWFCERNHRRRLDEKAKFKDLDQVLCNLQGIDESEAFILCFRNGMGGIGKRTGARPHWTALDNRNYKQVGTLLPVILEELKKSFSPQFEKVSSRVAVMWLVRTLRGPDFQYAGPIIVHGMWSEDDNEAVKECLLAGADRLFELLTVPALDDVAGLIWKLHMY